MCGGSGAMGGMSAHHDMSFTETISGGFGFLGRLAADVLTVLTSGAALGFLAALVLLLMIGFLLRLLLTRRVLRL